VAQVDYKAILDEAWQQHLAPRAENAPTVISTFAGCGGSSLGYSMAGFRELLAVEWDDNAVETFQLNFPDVPVYHGDIHKLTVEQCLQMTGLQAGELDVLDGSPPCQGFSTAGKRILNDDRNQLYMEFVRLLRGLKPRVFIMENVSGLVKGKMKLVFAQMMRELKASGYKVRCKLLNAMYFHVPQSRQRLIFIGVRDDLGKEASHPRAKSKPVTVKEALHGVVPITMTGDCVARNHVYHSATTRRLWERPFGTLSGRMNRHGIHPTESRYFAIEECQRGASFPDGFQFVGTPTDKCMRIGNSVPPLFMRAIAGHVYSAILTKG